MNPVYAQSKDVVYRTIAGEHVLVPIRHKAVDLKSIYTLNEVGAFVWTLIDGKRTLCDIRDRVLDAFDAEPDQASRDVGELLSSFEALSLTEKILQ